MNNLAENLFIPSGSFMIRTPMLPFENFFQLSARQNLDQILLAYLENPLITEAISIASPNLIKALEKHLTSNSERKKEQALMSLLKYLLRMSTRATPFGLFACVGKGELGEQTHLSVSESAEIKKRARPDMAWLHAVIEEAEQNRKLIQRCQIVTNPLSHCFGNRLVLDYKTNDLSGHKSISVRRSILTDFITKRSKTPLMYTHLEEETIQNFPHLDPDKIKNLIWNLFSQKFLISELSPFLLSAEPFERFLEHLEKYKDVYSGWAPLAEIQRLIRQYNQSKPGENKGLLEELHDKAQALKPSTYSIQVDAASISQNVLNKAVAYELGEAVEILWRLPSSQKESNYLDKIHLEFLEKYGTKQLVSLEDLADECKGLGLRNLKFDHPEVENGLKNEKLNAWNGYLQRQYLHAVCNQQEIDVSEDIWKYLNKEEISPLEAALSFDIYCELFAASQKSLDEGDFLISIGSNTGAGQGGSTFGRFLDILDAKLLIQDIFAKEQALDPHTCFVESTFLPSSPRTANVAIHDNLREFAIHLHYPGNSNQDMPLDDLYVGATTERLFLVSKTLQKEVNVTATNVLNSNLGPAILRFLRDLSKQKFRPLKPFEWGDLAGFPYLPRVRYKKTILSPAKWILTQSTLEANKEQSSLQELKNNLQKWIKTAKLPRYVYLTFFDNRILLDLQNDTHQEELIHELKKQEKIILAEQIDLEKCRWIKSSSGSHLCEFVIPYVRNPKYVQTLQTEFTANFEFPDFATHVKLPGSDWLYVKIFLAHEAEEEFLTKYLYDFAQDILTKDFADFWYFIRYVENGKYHVRLRFKGNADVLNAQVLPLLHHWSYQLMHAQQIRTIELSCYEREVYRYGGVDAIDCAEEFFHADSLTQLSLLMGVANQTIKLPPHALAALEILDLLTQLNLDLTSQLNLLETVIFDKKLLAGFREWSHPLTTIGKLIIAKMHPTEDQSEETSFILASLRYRHPLLQEYGERIHMLQSQDQLSCPLQSIYHSLIHMSCNRLMGTDPEKENKAILYAYHVLNKVSVAKQKAFT